MKNIEKQMGTGKSLIQKNEYYAYYSIGWFCWNMQPYTIVVPSEELWATLVCQLHVCHCVKVTVCECCSLMRHTVIQMGCKARDGEIWPLGAIPRKKGPLLSLLYGVSGGTTHAPEDVVVERYRQFVYNGPPGFWGRTCFVHLPVSPGGTG